MSVAVVVMRSAICIATVSYTHLYAIIIEEMGIVGGVFVLLLYIILLVRVGMIARRCDKLFPKFLVLGCGLLVVVQALTNMAVAVDLIPAVSYTHLDVYKRQIVK